VQPLIRFFRANPQAFVLLIICVVLGLGTFVAVLIAIAACVALYLVLFVGLFVGQRKLLFRCDAAEVDPASLGLKAQSLRLKTEDGESLLAWSFPPAPERPLILYFHGNAGGLDLRVERFRAMAKAGIGFLAIEYRGYASSTGSPSERGLKLDGEAAYAAAIASGVAFPDALSGGALAGIDGAPMLLVPSNVPLPASMRSYFDRYSNTVLSAWLFGGTTAVSTPVAKAIAQALVLVPSSS